VPALLELSEQPGRAAHHLGVAGHALGASVPALGDEPGPLEYGHVLLHGSKRHVVLRGELADRRVGEHDARQDVAARHIGEGAEHLVERDGGRRSTYNHLVVDTSTICWPRHPPAEGLAVQRARTPANLRGAAACAYDPQARGRW
jgi:hypothetical protein